MERGTNGKPSEKGEEEGKKTRISWRIRQLKKSHSMVSAGEGKGEKRKKKKGVSFVEEKRE